MDPNSFDHHSEEFALDPAGQWQALRETCPVAHSDQYGGFYILTHYADVVAADRDAERFSSADDPFGKGEGGRGVTIPPIPMQFGFIEMDSPDHMQHRRIFSAWFGPRAIAQRKPAIRATTTQVIDRVIARGEADLVLDVVNPTTGMNMCALVGLPPEDWQRYMDPFRDSVIVNRAAPEFEQVMEKLDGVKDALRGLMEARRAQPRDDLITHVVHAETDGEPVAEDARLMDLFMIVSGGAETTVGLITHTLMHLHRDTELRARLVADPALIPAALEEFNRYYTPVPALARTVKEDCTLGGQQFKPGDRVLLAYGSANRDGAAFAQPDNVIIDRFPNRHVSFGVGPHRCIGSNFARAESTIVVEEILRRMPDYEVRESEAEKFPSVGITNSYLSMPARFTPGTPATGPPNVK